jgi:hypothetical protein
MDCRIALWRLRAVCHNAAWRSIAVLGDSTGGRFHVVGQIGAAK